MHADIQPVMPVRGIGIRQKMLMVLIGTLTISLGITGWLGYRNHTHQVLEETQRRGEDMSRFVARSLAYSVVGYDYHTIQLLLEEMVKSQDVVYAKVINNRGRLMAEAGGRRAEQPEWGRFEEVIRLDGEPVGRLFIDYNGMRIIRQLEERKSGMILREAAIILLIALGEFLALSWIIIRPLATIHQSLMEAVDDRGRIVSDIPITSGDEFGRLAWLFNVMRRELNEVHSKLQSRIDAADQQLRHNNEKLERQSRELQRVNRQLLELSITDPLTGLYNRRHFDSVIEAELALCNRHGEPLSVLLIDLDHFKRINDRWGHDMGDRVLREVAEVLRRHFRKTDVLCRLGGEEFVALCRRAGPEVACELGEKVRCALAQIELKVPGNTIHVTATIGVDSFDSTASRRAEDLMKGADEALYHGKKTGRNRVVHRREVSNNERS